MNLTRQEVDRIQESAFALMEVELSRIMRAEKTLRGSITINTRGVVWCGDAQDLICAARGHAARIYCRKNSYDTVALYRAEINGVQWRAQAGRKA